MTTPEPAPTPDPDALSVLVVRPTSGGGLAAHVDHEVRALRGLGVEVHEAQAHIGSRPAPVTDARAVRSLRRERTAHQVDAIHAHGLRAGALAALAQPRRDAPRLVVTLHNRPVGSRAVAAVGTLLMRVLARRADTVLAVSPDLAETARAAGARDVRHAVIPAPRPAAPPGRSGDPRPECEERPAGGTASSPRGGERADRPLDVLVLARLAPQKGLSTLLDAAALARDRAGGDALRIRVAGDGPLREQLAARIAAQALPVELLGRREDVPALLERTDLVVSAAVWEGQPVGLQEALWAGRAIVATDAGGTRWVTGEAATLVPVQDAEALATAILAHRDPARRQRAERASRARAAELPTEQDMTRRLLDVLAPAPR